MRRRFQRKIIIFAFFLYLILGALKRNAFGIITMWGTEPIESINANHSGEAFARFTNEAFSAAEQSVKSRRRLHNRYGFIPPNRVSI